MLSLIANRPEHPSKASYSARQCSGDIELELGSASEDTSRCLMADIGTEEANTSPQRLDDFLAVLDEVPQSRWPCWRTRRDRGGTGHEARRKILNWRLKRPYLIYCLCCSLATLFLLAWNLYKGMQNNWNLPQWKHHRWEEVLEVMLGACMVLETVLTLCVLGFRRYFTDCWCVFDCIVAVVTVISIGYGIEHIGRNGEISEADVPLLCLRFISQPARVVAICMGVSRTREMQQVNELQIDFDALQNNASGFSLQHFNPQEAAQR